jgi:hypothetical protein
MQAATLEAGRDLAAPGAARARIRSRVLIVNPFMSMRSL